MDGQHARAVENTGELISDIERRAIERSSGVGGRFWQISPDLLGVLKADGYFERTNPAWQTVLGWSEAEVCRVSIFELLHPDDREPTRLGFEHLKRGNPILRFENRYRRKDGGYNWFAWAAAPLGDAYYCSGRDITFEKEQAAELAATTIERDRVWQNARDLLVIIGADGIYRAVNPAWTAVRQLAEMARETRPDLKVLFVTGYAENVAVRGGFLPPGTDILSKPFTMDALAAKIREIIER